MSTNLLILRFASREKVVGLLAELVEQNQFDEVLELVQSASLSLSDCTSIVDRIFDKFQKKLASVLESFRENYTAERDYIQVFQNSKELQTYFELISKIPELWEQFNNWINTNFLCYVHQNTKRLFSEDFYTNVVIRLIKVDETTSNEDSGDDLEIELLLNVLECVYLSEVSPAVNHWEWDHVLILFLNSNIESIASTTSKLMRWRVQQIYGTCLLHTDTDELTWESIKYMFLEAKFQDWKERNALTFLLRFLAKNELSPNQSQFMMTAQYWENINTALNHKVHEYRKLALSILKLSVQRISGSEITSTNIDLFNWSTTQKGDILESWKKYTTLYEMIALDTSLNQIEAAKSDICSLFEDRFIHPDWNLILLSTGLQSSMESVRKYFASLLFEDPFQKTLSANMSLLRTTFLPSTLLAYNFTTTEDLNCPYGDKLSGFVYNLLNHAALNSKLSTLECVLNVLVDQGPSFEPARIYVAFGILQFLQENESSLIELNHLLLIRKLFEFESEEEIFQISIQTIYLKMLLYTSSTISVNDWIGTILVHLRCCKTYKFIRPLIPSFKKIALDKFDSKGTYEALLKKEPVNDVIVYLLFELELSSEDIYKEYIIELIASGCDFENSDKIESLAWEFMSELISNDYSDDKYLRMEKILPIIDKEKLESADFDGLYGSLLKNFSNSKFMFFTGICRIVGGTYVTLEQMLNIYPSLVECINASDNMSFRTKDILYGAYFNAITSIIDETSTEDVLEKLLDILTSIVLNYNSYYNTNMAIAEFYIKIFTFKLSQNYVEKSAKLLLKIWEIISRERLVLKEKNLHLRLIAAIFDSKLLHIAGDNLKESLYEVGMEICDFSFSRRGLLPLLSKKVCQFVREFHCPASDNHLDDWIVSIIINIFVAQQTAINIFKLKPVIGKLYDSRINVGPSLSSVYYEVYGDDEVISKFQIISLLLHTSNSFRRKIISSIILDTNALYSKKRIDGPEETQRLFLWQLLMLSLCLCDDKSLDETISDDILKSTENEASPLVRVYKEWFISYRLVSEYEALGVSKNTDYLFKLLNDHSKPILAVSAERILFMTLTTLSKMNNSSFEGLFEKYVSFLVANATSNKPLIRHFSNSLILSFWPIFNERVEDRTVKAIVENLYNNAKQTQIIGQYRAGDANVWDIFDDLTLTGIFGGVIKKVTDHDIQYISQKMFLKHSNLLGDQIEIGRDETSLWLDKRNSGSKEKPSLNTFTDTSNTSPLQTKSGAWETVMDLDNNKTNDVVKRSDLIVISSLVDKPPNLGGICRLCDVLGVGLLTVQDIKVKNHPQFKNVAVTADKWMPIEEVPVDKIIDFMKSKKREGYTLIGLEQTDKSIKLDTNYKFPKKSLILLGTEAFGIPGHLLSELDLCLEIQQFGVIRSMNIQTATAVIVHSYTIQHM
ncbi:hypothetical protein KAFR_0A06820 [Kazachstania africana CBS 2517]|uniref:tRNA/rRNA methyltransferase SpoU type domain-containing protein n=1 Tax=Kazachstania africana (strain ATCC 22294 / BCRC 22015 / CBS 2517 / CECT 1963 / NBRC 1671 / NRRL Y-8276) TaxID=1071382 RepID=H2AP17_KAZAF|nr:hypothetical protein KAFR_0A06820 [Kazachstania africana CBS 2517]CCF56117.1 hypothetical protein KAFR_0A06820 [Kazachstania africana CBS 2517]